MNSRAERTRIEPIAPLREMYRLEMRCQIIHDSIHYRKNWSREYMLIHGGEPAGYGSVAVGGPWQEMPAIYEFYVRPPFRTRMFELFETLVASSGISSMEVQSNDALATTMLHTYAGHITTDSILFHDRWTTSMSPDDAQIREATLDHFPGLDPDQLKWHAVLELDGETAARGGVLFHYNRPYGDIFMEVEEPYRRRGLGAFIVQELKRRCYAGGHIPGARCNPRNIASRRTLQKAGFVPCGHMLSGTITGRP